MRVEPFKIEHFRQVVGRENGIEDWAIKLQYERSFYTKLDGTPGQSAITIFQQDLPICCAGFMVISGLGYAWIHICDNPPIFIYRTIKKHTEQFFRDSGIRRAETVIPSNNLLNNKFVQAFGFTLESIAENYFPDCPGYRWEWVRR